MELRIAVCDDAEEDRTYVSGLVKDWAVQAGHQAEITAFSSAESFLFRYAEDKNWDILLLDIEMGAMDGVSLAKRVRKDNEAVQIVFVTGYSDYIAEGYEVAALHYLMKPVSGEKLFAVLNRALEKRKREERCLNLELGGEMVRIPFYDIRYLDVRHPYVKPTTKKFASFLKFFRAAAIAARSCSIRYSWLMLPFQISPFLKSPA